MALIGNAKQATSEGKSGRLTGPAATAMTCALHVNHINYCWTVHECSQLAAPSSHSFPCPLAQKTRSPLAMPLSAGSPKAWWLLQCHMLSSTFLCIHMVGWMIIGCPVTVSSNTATCTHIIFTFSVSQQHMLNSILKTNSKVCSGMYDMAWPHNSLSSSPQQVSVGLIWPVESWLFDQLLKWTLLPTHTCTECPMCM